MVTFFTYLIFIFSVAFTSAGVVLSTRLRSRSDHKIFSSLFYFQVFIFAFGFYGIWGQIVVKSLLSGLVSPELLGQFSNISLLLGLPFLLFAWLMLIKFSSELTGTSVRKWFMPVFLGLNFLALFLLGWFIRKGEVSSPELLIRIYFISFTTLYTIASSLVLVSGRNRSVLLGSGAILTVSGSLVLIILLQSIALLLNELSVYAGLVFIFLFFAGNSFLPVYLSYGTSLNSISAAPVMPASFEELCKKFEISPRESDIIREICNGLTNQEISEKLFISLQTVKDHTHRIYIKTNVRNRVQLINLYKGSPG